MPFDDDCQLGFRGADDLGNTFHSKHDFEADSCGARTLALACKLDPVLQNLDPRLAANTKRIPIY
jgi:hypothetical protein